MIPTEIDSVSAAAIQGQGIEAVVDWFERHQQSFYTLGWLYLRNQRQVEELFYRSIIKVHKELPRFKKDTSFEMWVTSIFFEICRELSQQKQASEEMEPSQDLIKALDQLEGAEKEALLLTYVKGLSPQDSAQILGVSVDKLKGLLFSGIQSIRNQLNESNYNGCKDSRKNYINYLEKSMERPEKIEFEKHIYHCQNCQEDLAAFQDVTIILMEFAEQLNDFEVQKPIMDIIKERLAGKEKQRQQKFRKRKRKALIFASVFLLVFGIGFFTGGIPKVYYAWTEEDEQLRTFLQNDLGQRLNLEAESEGIKITIKGVVADDFQTLVFYEIEDTKEDNQYLMSYESSLMVENENEIMEPDSYPHFYLPDLEADMNKQKNIFYGKFGLRPIREDTETVKIKISQLMKLSPDSSDSMRLGYMGSEHKSVDLSFEIPVTKQPSIEYKLDKETEIEGVPVRFDKVTIAPTATILHYGLPTGQRKKRMEFVSFGELEVNNKKLKTDRFSGFYPDSQEDRDWQTFQTHFDPIYGEKPNEVKVQFASAYFTIEDDKSIELDVNQKVPQTFEYADSTISIDKVEVGQPTTIVISNYKNREYESLHLNIVDEYNNESVTMQMDVKGILVDKNGVEYDPMKDPIDYEKIEQPRHFITEQTIFLDGDNKIPKRLDLTGYNRMIYLDDVVTMSVE